MVGTPSTDAGRTVVPEPFPVPDCPLCAGDGGDLVWRSPLLRVVLPDEPLWPGFTRVVLARHVAEMTDLDAAARDAVMATVWRVEQAMRAVLAPDKVNVASLGNMVPHLHWHLVPRWRDDANFPAAPWAPVDAQGAGRAAAVAARLAARLPAYREALRQVLEAGA
jgi:diadenosine tetraphosphate (Ap4A) HIT family hydrolase